MTKDQIKNEVDFRTYLEENLPSDSKLDGDTNTFNHYQELITIGN